MRQSEGSLGRAFTVKVLICLLIFIFIFGPTEFISKIFVSSLGVMIHNMTSMATFTDPIVNGGFPEAWTIFFVAFPLSYTGLMGVFVAKISKGRTVRELVLSCMLGISIGTWVFFSINSGLAMHADLEGSYSIVNDVMYGDPYRGVFHVLDTIPLGIITAIIYTVCVSGFICTTLDAASLCLASTSQDSLTTGDNREPSKKIRLFWCVMLTLVPLAVMFSGASFDTLKQLAILVSIPLAIVLVGASFGLMKWIHEDKLVQDRLLVIQDETEYLFQKARMETEEGAPVDHHPLTGSDSPE